MFAFRNDRTRGPAVLIAAVGLLGGLMACASPPASTRTGPADPVVLSDVRVEERSGTTVVELVGVGEPLFSAFQEQDPPRVVVDLRGVVPAELADRLVVDDGTVDEIRLSPNRDAEGVEGTRVELALATVAEHQVVPVADGLELRVIPEYPGSLGDAEDLVSTSIDAADLGDAGAGDDSVEIVDASELAEASELAGAQSAPAAADPSAAPRARSLLEIRPEPGPDGLRLVFRADGRIADAEHFVLQDPLRLVVDLPELVNRFPQSRLAVGEGPAGRVRVGQHEDKVRVVLDAAEGVGRLEPARLEPHAQGMVLSLGAAVEPVGLAEAETETREAPEVVAASGKPESGSAAAASATSSETPPAAADEAAEQGEPAEAQDAGGASRVYGVQLDSQTERDRITILTDAPARFRTTEPDADTFMVQIAEARIAPDAEVNLRPAEPGPVALVTAFEQPDMDEPEVRVVIRRAQGAEPQVRQEGSMLVLDFPRDGSVAQAVPASSGASAAEAASRAADKAMAQTASQAKADVPAALAPDEAGSLDLLQEGGLVDGKQYSGRRISLDFKDVDIDDVLRLIAEVSDLNIIAGDEVKGEVTIRLVDVPWDQALDVILLTRGLGFVRVGNVLRIAPAEQIKAEEEARLQEKRAKEKLEDLVVKLQPVNYASVKEVEKMVTRLLTPRGSVDIDERTNTVILKDISSVIAEATALIKAIDTQTPQVMIEAKIVEANLDFLRQVGSKFALGVQPNVDAFDEDSGLRQDQGSGDFILRPNQNPALVNNPNVGNLSNANNVVVANPITELATGLVNVGAFILDERFDVDLQLEAAESHGEGKVISSPRVVTLDNREASIEQGVSIPFQTFEDGDAELEFIDAVLRLEVTPHITADRSIIMQIKVERNAPDLTIPTSTGSPAIAKNEAETETLVKDGQTLVIGGIYVVSKSDRESRVPYLHALPILGNAFKNKQLQDDRQELLVFVTPRIVVNPELGT